MMNMFALGLEEAFEPREHLLTDLGIARLGYADDLHLYGKVEALVRKWPFIVGILGSAGLEVQPTKSKFWSPTADKREADAMQVDPTVLTFANTVKRSIGGLDLLGGAAASSHEIAHHVAVGNPITITAHAEKRFEKASHYADRVRAFEVSQVTPYVTHKAWMITAKSVAKAFSYDAALIPRQVLEPAVKQVMDKVYNIASLCVGGLDGETDAMDRLRLTPVLEDVPSVSKE